MTTLSLYPDLSFPEESFLYKSLSLLKDSGKAGYVDATAFHDNGNASWGIKRDYMNLVYSWLQTLALGNLEVWVTECGLPHSTVSPDVDQAASVSRVLLTYATEDVDRATAVDEYADMVFYYNLKDDPYQSGLLQNTQPLSTYDAYKYYKTLETVLGTAVGDDPAAAVFRQRQCPGRPEALLLHPAGRRPGDSGLDGERIVLERRADLHRAGPQLRKSLPG